MNKVKKKVMGTVAACNVALTGLMFPVSADTTIDSATVNSEVDADTMVSNILGIILQVATFIGAAMLIWGLVMFGLAIKNDEPESKQKALMTAFAGVILVGIRTILQGANILN